MLPIKPRKANQYLSKVNLSIFENEDSNDVFDIVIILDNTYLSFRELSNFFLVIDHFYGRFYPKGFLSYSKTESIQLKADEIVQGSIETVIGDILSKLPVDKAFFFFMLIKYLPSALKSFSEVTKNFAEAFHSYEQGKEIRFSRKLLKRQLREDQALKNLSDDELAKLVRRLQKLYDQDGKLIGKAADFASRKMKRVEIRRRKK